MSGRDKATMAWYVHADKRLQQKIDMIRVYQFKCPDLIGPLDRGPWPRTWWSEFWKSLEHNHADRRYTVMRRWMETHQPGGYQTDFSEVFNISPELCPYIRHGQQTLHDYE